ncbi:glycosyltransferase family 2 protein [Parerythrobacter jejuensis]|uniref:Glycosyltransferase n=1 Tax=Parerythrobacter jejuensis TaxID=795812 RepID=A0A845AK34_9SPHN|nr:glycosyltransferase family 2 protein [Parerythrobacter jejuensis]MXP31102.1 glycosyltransferase [Parerythrobacter jejuensis]MXP33862.1 glycosyltransferase [Parerythrobacter jejuensis]
MTPRFSVVTISYNQDAFLLAAMDSVLSQTHAEIEYILCDPGSTDTSRAIIDANPDPRIIRVFEPDEGPADGLNKGFAQATGDIFYYLNSDDLVLPGAFACAAQYFAAHPEVDVLCGHAEVIDETGKHIRCVWSEPFQRYAVATGAHVQIQPATFIRADAFRKAGGFDASDRGNWDGGLLTSLFLSGARIEVIDAVLGAYRLHADSITMSGKLAERHHANALRNFERLMGRPWDWRDDLGSRALRLAKHLRHPRRTIERLQKGPLFKAG